MSLIPTDSGLMGMISKASPAEAQMLLQIGLFEAMGDLLDEHGEEIQKGLSEVAKVELVRADRQARRIIKADLDAGLEVDPGLFDTLEDIAKALVEYGKADDWDESKVKRDQGGRFSRFKWAGRRDVRVSRDGRQSTDFPRSDREKVTDEMSQPQRDDRGNYTIGRGNVVDPNLRGKKDQAALFDAMRLAVDPASSARIARAMSDKDGRLDRERLVRGAHNISRESSAGDRRVYRQLETIGSTVRGLSTPGSTTNLVAAFAEMTGKLGPEAEDILGPGIRRTAYRYRGVERRPSESMSQSNAHAASLSDAVESRLAAGESWAKIKSDLGRQLSAAAGGRPGSDALNSSRLHPEQKIAYNVAAGQRGITPDRFAMRVQGDTAVAAFIGAATGSSSVLATMPELDLSLASGELPPSQGVIINADGRMVTQAHGHRGDHYLPFNLKNLKSLQGGQYVRTRAMGGPSTEDIYTGLVTGARQMQVVSNSGVYTIEFDPDLRGVRRYSDKARQMVRRYESLLKTIDGNKRSEDPLMERDLSPETKRQIRQQAWQAAGGSEERFRQNQKALTQQAISQEAYGSDMDFDEVLDAANAHADRKIQIERGKEEHKNLSNAAFADMHRELVDSYLEENGVSGASKLALNGEGYHRALRTLAQEFPYFVRSVEYSPLKDWTRERGLQNDAVVPSRGMSRRADRGYKSPQAVEQMLYGERRAQVAQEETQEQTSTPAAGATSRATSLPATSTDGRQRASRVDSAVKRVMRRDLSLMINHLKQIEPVVSLEPGDQTMRPGNQFDPNKLHYAMRNTSRDAAVDLATSVLVGLSAEDLGLMKTYLEQPDITDFVPKEQRPNMRKYAESVSSLVLTANPFSSSTNPMSEPSAIDPMPPRVDGVPDPRESTPEEIESEIKSLGVQDPAFKSDYEQIAGGTDPAQALSRFFSRMDIEEMDDDEQAAVARLNTAWAYHAALNASKKLEAMLPKEASGPGKASGPSLGPDERPVHKRSRGGSASPSRTRSVSKRLYDRPTAPWTPPRSVVKSYYSDLASRIEKILG